jgi:serine/threonine-protein kinase
MSHRIGRYEIQGEVGRGGFGQVYRAFDPTVGRLVAIKTLASGGDPELLKRFRNEAAASGRFRHNNIVIVYDFGEHEGSPYLVMELLDGEDLERIINDRRPLTLLQKLDIITQSAAGLHHAHAAGIVHRDIKPANIMLQDDGVVKIMDFGIALLSQATAARITPKGSMVGTFPYMAPEQFYGSSSDALTDIFAFGVTCYKLLTGVHPFHADEMGAMMYNIMNKTPEPLRALSPECPEALEQALFRMLAKERDARYQSLDDVRFDLEPVIVELRRERVNDLLSEARGLMVAQRLDNAQAMVRKALEADPGNRTARDLRETLQRQIRENEIRPRIAALVNAGREEFQARHFPEAIQKYESALQLDKSNAELQGLLVEARTAWDKAKRTTRLINEAQQSLTQGDLTGARRTVLEAISLDPGNADAEGLRGTIEQSIEARDRARRLEEAINHCRRLMHVESFDQAIERLQALVREYPDSAAARELLARAHTEFEKQERRRRLQAAIDEAKALLKTGRFAAAVEHLSLWRGEFQESSELRDLASFAEEELRAQKQAEVVATANARVKSLIESQEFDEALDLLKAAITEYPAAGALRELVQSVGAAKSEYERRTALEEAIAETNLHLADQRFREAADRIGVYARAYGDTAELAPLRRQAEEGLEKQRRLSAVRQVMTDARALLDENKPDAATKVLQVGTVQFPGYPELANLLSEAQQRLQEQRQAEAVSKVIAEAESLTRARQFERALAALDNGLQEYPGTERLIRCRQATLASAARHHHEEAERQTLERIRDLHQGGKLEEALAATESALREFGEKSVLLDLQRRITADHVARERAAELHALTEQAQRLVESGQLEPALQVVVSALERFPGEESLAKLRDLAELRLRDVRRKEAKTRALTEAREHLAHKRFKAALETLGAGQREYGSDKDFVRAIEIVANEKAAFERQQACEDLQRRAADRRAAGQLTQALDLLNSGLKEFGEIPELLRLKNEIEAELQARHRERLAQNVAKRAEDLLERKRPAEAVSLIEQELPDSDHPRITEVLRHAREAAAQQEYERAIESVIHEARQLADRGKHAESLAVIDAALKQHPATDGLSKLREAVLAAQRRAQLLADARGIYAAGRLEFALDMVCQALEKAPADQEFQELNRQIEADLHQRRRTEVVRKALEEANAAIAGGRSEEAVALLRPVMTKYPGEPKLAEVLSAAEAELKRAERQREVVSVRAQAEALIAEQKYAEAVALLNSRLPGEARLQHLLAYAQEHLDIQRERETRGRTRIQLIEIEQRIPTTRKSKLKGVLGDVKQLVAPYPDDLELSSIASRIERQVDGILSVPVQRREVPWKWLGAIGGGVAVVAAGLLIGPEFFRSRETPKSVVPSTFPVEIRTDPPGAAVSVGDHSCRSPDCRLALPAGQYKIEAKLNGYKPAMQTLTVNADRPPGITSLTLEPEPPPPLPAGSQRGTLLVRVGIPGARVLVDNVARGITDARGEFQALLEAGSHTVRVEKSGYRAPAEQRVALSDKRLERLSVNLTPQPATLEIRDVPADIEIQAGGGGSRRTDGSGRFSMAMQPGEQVVQVSDGKSTRQFSRVFDPGATVSVNWRDVAPPKTTITPPPPPPPTVTAEMKEAQAWERARTSNDPDQIESFLREHRNGAHAAEAQTRLDDLYWSRVNQGDASSLQNYVTRFPRGSHIRDAQRLLDDLAWNAVNKTNLQSLQGFVEQNGGSRHRTEAQTIIDRLSRDKREADERRNQQQQVVAAERLAIRAALQRFNDAFVHKSARELKQIWPGALPEWLESMNQRGAYFVATLYPVGEPDVTGDRAMMKCDLITQTILRGQPQPQNRKTVRVTLRKTGDHWLIEDPRGPA